MDSPDEITGPISLRNPVEFTTRQLVELTIELTELSSKNHSPAAADR
jgi:phage FluMu protein gp41